MRNGALIDVHLRYTQQALDALRNINGVGVATTRRNAPPSSFSATEQHGDADAHQRHRPPGQQQLGQVQVRPAEVAGKHEQADQDQQDGGNEVESHRVGEGSGVGRIS
ncbi:hypothetical protein G6F24_016039 [Rhizopus arrhizus]|nr:hypothetical protein G6F24_016039 [Rhizopus arrhizus]